MTSHVIFYTLALQLLLHASNSAQASYQPAAHTRLAPTSVSSPPPKASPVEVLVAFQTAWVEARCQDMYAMMAPQPLGNWFANADGPNTYTVLNRTNIVAICEAFNNANASAAWYVLPQFTQGMQVGADHGMIGFGSAFTFRQGALGDKVCSVVWLDFYQARVVDGQIVEMWEFYDADAFGQQWQRCNPTVPTAASSLRFPATTAAHTASRPRATMDIKLTVASTPHTDLANQVLSALYQHRCTVLDGLISSNFELVDPNISPEVSNRSAFLRLCADTSYGESAAAFSTSELSATKVMVQHVYGFGVLDPVAKAPCCVMNVETMFLEIVVEGGTAKASKLTTMFNGNSFNSELKAKCHSTF